MLSVTNNKRLLCRSRVKVVERLFGLMNKGNLINKMLIVKEETFLSVN